MTFNPAQFIIDYPQFANISSTTLTNVFINETLPQCGWITTYAEYYTTWTDTVQYYWQCMVLAHILTARYGANGSGSGSQLLGRVSAADTGKVKVKLTYTTPDSYGDYAAEWNKTVYGQTIYKMIVALPVAMYVC